MWRRYNRDGRGTEEVVMYRAVQNMLPCGIRRHVLYFESVIEDAVAAFAQTVPEGGLILDAGAGEARHSRFFAAKRYVGVDMAVGDSTWDYRRLHAIADLASLPFSSGTFDACINIVTLEHVPEPGWVLREIERTLRPGGRLLLIVPQEWEVHQPPHDYFRFTCYGLRYLLEKAGLINIEIKPVGGYFRLIARRLLNGLQFFRGIWFVFALVGLVPPALMLALLDRFDHERAFTLGYVCSAEKARPR
jgi:SAM-dependent methyltransferase